MYLISVYPIIRGNWTNELQYWSTLPIDPGSIIKAPLRGKTITALVFDSVPLKSAKSSIKEAEFKTRKITDPRPLEIVRPEYVKAVLSASTFFVQNIGAILKATIPQIAFETSNDSTELSTIIALDEQENTLEQESAPQKNSEQKPEHKPDSKADILALGTNTEDRLSTYKSMIREELARKKTVLLIAPTVRTAEILFDSIKKGIEHMTVLLHGSLTKKTATEAWLRAIDESKQTVIVATPQYLAVPRQDISTIIFENESSRAYKTFIVPFFDWRYIIEQYAKRIGARLLFGDTMLSLETIHKIDEHEIHEFFPLSHRIQSDAELLIVDMQEAKRKTGDYKLLSEELHSMIEYAQKKKQNIFIFTARRGLSPQTVCSDCGTAVACKHCLAPVVLHNSQKQGRYFLCHHCGRERTALEACIKCNSWNLTTLGIGSDTVAEEIKKQFPEMPIFKIDKESAKSDKEAKKIYEEFMKKNGQTGAVLIGTEIALSYLEHIKYVAIASIDSLFSIPDFRIQERIIHILLRLFEIAESFLLIQTRNADSSIMKALSTKTFSECIKEEMEMRKLLNYPPFSIMGKASLTGPQAHITKQAKKIESLLVEYNPIIFPAMIPGPNGQTINILFTVPKEVWQQESRVQHDLFVKLQQVGAITPVHILPESFI